MQAQACLCCDRRIVFARGNCACCFQRLKKLVAKGTVTDAELISQGRLLPALSKAQKNDRMFARTFP